jgi:hypothetical protein
MNISLTLKHAAPRFLHINTWEIEANLTLVILNSTDQISLFIKSCPCALLNSTP